MSKTFKSGEACRELDVQPYVLRYWETEFSALGGKKSGPQRTYSAAEIKILKRIKELLYDEGYTIAGAKKKLEGEVDGEVEPEASVAETSAEPSPAKKASAGKQKSANKGSKAAKKPAQTAKGKAAAGKKRATGSRSSTKTTASEESSLDSAAAARIEHLEGALRKLHGDAQDVLARVRALGG